MAILLPRNGQWVDPVSVHVEVNGRYRLCKEMYLRKNNQWNLIFGRGSGTQEDPYLIRTEDELYLIEEDPTACYILTRDIRLEQDHVPVCTSTPFTGHFDGNHHTITNIHIHQGYGQAVYAGSTISVQGVFGHNAGTIEDLYVLTTGIGRRSEEEPDDVYCGSIAGLNTGTIRRCRYMAQRYLGGINQGGCVGWNGTGGVIEDCVTKNSIYYGTGIVGGVAAKNAGTIRRVFVYLYWCGGSDHFTAANSLRWLTAYYQPGVGNISYCRQYSYDRSNSLTSEQGENMSDVYGNSPSPTSKKWSNRSDVTTQSWFSTFDFENVWHFAPYESWKSGYAGPDLRGWYFYNW